MLDNPTVREVEDILSRRAAYLREKIRLWEGKIIDEVNPLAEINLWNLLGVYNFLFDLRNVTLERIADRSKWKKQLADCEVALETLSGGNLGPVVDYLAEETSRLREGSGGRGEAPGWDLETEEGTERVLLFHLQTLQVKLGNILAQSELAAASSEEGGS